MEKQTSLIRKSISLFILITKRNCHTKNKVYDKFRT